MHHYLFKIDLHNYMELPGAARRIRAALRSWFPAEVQISVLEFPTSSPNTDLCIEPVHDAEGVYANYA